MFFNKDYTGYRKHVCSLTKIIMVIGSMYVL